MADDKAIATSPDRLLERTSGPIIVLFTSAPQEMELESDRPDTGDFHEPLPPQLIRTAQERFLREYEANPGPWHAKVPNYRTILEEERKKWRAKNEF